MADVKGIKECMEVLEGFKVIGVAGKRVFADGKISFADLSIILGLLNNFSKVNAAIAGVEQIPLELKDLSQEEANLLLAKILEVVAALKAA